MNKLSAAKPLQDINSTHTRTYSQQYTLTWTHTRTHIHKRTHAHTHRQTHTPSHPHTHMHTHRHARTHAQTHTRTCTMLGWSKLDRISSSLLIRPSPALCSASVAPKMLMSDSGISFKATNASPRALLGYLKRV